MGKTLNLYNGQQFDEIHKFIIEHFGEQGGYIAHDIKSEYVHTDVMIIAPEGEKRTFVTFGMGAREMTSPTDFKRTELVLSASEEIEVTSEESLVIANELNRTSKFPFREETWFGSGHTIDVSDKFREMTGYEYFAFWNTGLGAALTGIDEKVHFLRLVPIYAAEREWCVENNTFAFLDKLYEKHGKDIFLADVKREPFIPEIDEDELDIYEMVHELMSLLEFDSERVDALCEYLDEISEEGEEVSYETIVKWLEEDKND